MENKIKRTDGNIISWILLISFLISLALGILGIMLNWVTEIGDNIIMSMVIMGLGVIARLFLFHSQNVRVVYIYIFLYEISNCLNVDTDEYELRYNFYPVELVANFLLTFRLKDTDESLSIEDLETILKNEYGVVNGYKTKGAMLIDIKGYIESIIKSQKVDTLPKIKGAMFLDSLDVEKEIEKIKNIKNGK